MDANGRQYDRKTNVGQGRRAQVPAKCEPTRCQSCVAWFSPLESPAFRRGRMSNAGRPRLGDGAQSKAGSSRSAMRVCLLRPRRGCDALRPVCRTSHSAGIGSSPAQRRAPCAPSQRRSPSASLLRCIHMSMARLTSVCARRLTCSSSATQASVVSIVRPSTSHLESAIPSTRRA